MLELRKMNYDDVLIGEFRIRHCLTESLKVGAGHES